MPLAWMRIGAELFRARAASVRANVWPELTREDKISFRRDVVQGNGATAAPQRLTTTSTPSNARSSTVPRSGSQRNSLSAAGSRRTSRTTSSPSVASWFRSALPRNPDAPASNHFTCYRPPLENAGERQPISPISCHFPALFVAGERTDAPNGLTVRTRAELGVEVAFLESGLDGAEEPGRFSSVHKPVVVGHRQVHHVAHRDHLAELRIGDHHRTLDQRAGAEDGDLGLVDDRGVHQRTGRAVIRDREGAAAQLVGADLVLSGAGGEVADFLGQSRDVEITRVPDYRNQQALFGVDRDADVFRVGIGDGLSLGVDGGVDLRVDLERLDGRLGDER